LYARPVADATDEGWMRAAIDAASGVRATAHPNPWVGCTIVADAELVATGATRPPGQAHAEVDALEAAGDRAHGATAYVTLEPCSHTGRTGPCVDALLDAGIARVVVAVLDPDPRVRGSGVDRLRDGGVAVDVGCAADLVEDQLAPYLHQRRTGRPYVVVKLAATLDGRTAAPDRTSQWITGPVARADAHRLRAESDSIVVGAGTVRADDPTLTARDADGPDPERIVLGKAPAGARVHPCTEWDGPVEALLDDLGGRGHVQTLFEGGATVAGDLHRAGLVDRYVVYLAPALLGGDDAPGLFRGAGAATIADAWRGRIDAVTTLGQDVRIDLVPTTRTTTEGTP
jgi:diaminohydroxyphosphoribosylaminopyrimidine deaminase/5-amino-6-(5-phosphoribosylamino)uracil reductase